MSTSMMTPRLSDTELRAIATLVYQKSGIVLHEGKRELITSRLQTRLRALGLATYAEYLTLAERTPAELVTLLDSIATNHTHFFREAAHFEVLTSRVLPGGELRGWCAACSTGEEPYSILMALLEAGCGSVRLLASDMSTKALATAKSGVYRLDKMEHVPKPGLARVQPSLRRLVDFRALNLLEVTSLGQQFDFIFCRNVMIYFDKAVQQRVVSMLERHLKPGGYLFIAHAESLNGITHGLATIAPAALQRRAA
jgi:chemotaxis protein methyltransferase CheR